jgi:hypothetical protein
MTLLNKVLLGGILLTSTLHVSGHADHISDYVKEIPGIGLISDSIEFDGITISDFAFETGHKYIFVKPGDKFVAQMHYEIDAAALASLHLHHFIIGLHVDGPQDCILHSMGLTDSKGETKVTLKAPKNSGAYQVRFCHAVGLTFEDAKEAWWRGEGASANTIMGIVIVQ